MPIHEAPGYRRSHLTKEQRRQQEAALYGLTERTDVDLQQFSPEDLERMRAILQQHDAQNKVVNEFDLNNPKTPPYRHQDFPFTVYHHETGRSKSVINAADLTVHLENGWSKDPAPPEAPAEPELSEEDIAEVAAIDKAARKKKG